MAAVSGARQSSNSGIVAQVTTVPAKPPTTSPTPPAWAARRPEPTAAPPTTPRSRPVNPAASALTLVAVMRTPSSRASCVIWVTMVPVPMKLTRFSSGPALTTRVSPIAQARRPAASPAATEDAKILQPCLRPRDAGTTSSAGSDGEGSGEAEFGSGGPMAVNSIASSRPARSEGDRPDSIHNKPRAIFGQSINFVR